MARRIHPRHLKHEVSVTSWVPAGNDGSWSPDSVTLRAQVEHTNQIVTDVSAGTRAVTVLVLRINPPADVDVMAVCGPKSQVVHEGDASWVLSCRPVWRHGRVVYFEVKTGEDRPSFGGWWVDLVLHRSAGRDRRGNPTAAQDVTGLRGLFVPGDSTEPVDLDQSAVSTGRLHLAADIGVASTDAVTVLAPPAAAAGYWQITSAPLPDGTGGVVVNLRRT